MRLLAWLSCQSPIKCKVSLKVKLHCGCSLRHVQAWKRFSFGGEECAVDLLSYSPACIPLHSPLQESLISSEALESISHPLRMLYPTCSSPACPHLGTKPWEVPDPGDELDHEGEKINIPKSARVLFVEGICTSERSVDFWET